MNGAVALLGDYGRQTRTLTEPEIYAVLTRAGLRVPRFQLLRPQAASELKLQGPIVLKVVSRDILHKTDVGGVRFVDSSQVTDALLSELIASAAHGARATRGHAPTIEGVLAVERVDYDRTRLASEVIVGLRRTSDFGPVGLIGLGGLKAELLGSRLPRREGLALFDPCDPERAFDELRATLVYRDLAGQLRGSEPAVKDEVWWRLLTFLREMAAGLMADSSGGHLEELEFNPFVVRAGELIPLDGLARFSTRERLAPRPPLGMLEHLLCPRTVAVAGVSSKTRNMGRIILGNLLRDGFAPEQLVVIKPDEASIDGVRCTTELTETVDLAVLAVSAQAATELAEKLIHNQRARSLIVIPGGMAEKEGGAATQARLEHVLFGARASGVGPVLVGPNSMGVRSLPGHLDTTFIPSSRLASRTGPLKNLAFISQSGAFTITREDQFSVAQARYVVSAGNQVDLSVADFVEWVLGDSEVQVVAAYIEGFKRSDGERLIAAARRAKLLGKQLIVYKAGRTTAGQQAASGHTAAMAGDSRVAWHLLSAAGVLVAESFSEFEGFVRLSCALAGRRRGQRVMLMSNAGFEVVAMADHLEGESFRLGLASLSANTQNRMRATLSLSSLDTLVDVRNPLDVTPSASDATYAELAQAALADSEVDALVLGIVPMSPALKTLAHGTESIDSPDSLAQVIPRLFANSGKPMVVVVDASALYSPLVHCLETRGVPVFRRADEATVALGRWLCVR